MFLRSASLIAVLALAAFPANAGVVFHYKASALETQAGAEGVYDKIAVRAKAACNMIGERGLWRERARAACEADVAAALVEEIGDGNLSAVHSARASYRLSAR